MSINWVMRPASGPDPFVKLPHERILYISPGRCSIHLSTDNAYPEYISWNIKSDNGVAYVTDRRVVYLPAKPTPEFSSFSSPCLSLIDTYYRSPFFGPNYWVAACKPTSGGGIPPEHPIVDVKLTFRDGGAPDFHIVFEQVKDRHHQARNAAREQGRQFEPTGDINMEQLPAYEAASEIVDNGMPPAFGSDQSGLSIDTQRGRDVDAQRDHPATPDEPPPDYEEAQAQAVEVSFEEAQRRAVMSGRNSATRSLSTSPVRRGYTSNHMEQM